MNRKLNKVSTQKIQYEVDLKSIKKKPQKSKYTESVIVRLTEETKKELTKVCREEEVFVSTLIREVIEGFLKQKEE